MAVNPIRERLDRAQALDLRRQAQIAEQVKIINRLLEGATYDDILREALVALSGYAAKQDHLLRELARYRQVDVSVVEAELEALYRHPGADGP